MRFGAPALSAFLFLLAAPDARAQQTYHVSPSGNDSTGDGSAARPWATIANAVARVPDNGSTILVASGTYTGRIRMNRRFTRRLTVRAETPYRARLQALNEAILTIYGGANYEIRGFEFLRPSPDARGTYHIHVQNADGNQAEDVLIADNIFHDSYNNDLVKVNNGPRRVTIEGNVFYNQTGSDEHIDINGVTGVMVRDNIFFNDFAGSGRVNLNNTSSFIVIKNSASLPENARIHVRRNVFLNWEGNPGSNFVLIGEDGKPHFEAEDVTVENNLMIGNSRNIMRAPFGVKGGRRILFRNNTVTGDLPSNAYCCRLNREAANPVNESIHFHNNIWSDPTGTMEDFSDGALSESRDVTLSNNLYWNGGRPIPTDGDILNYTADRQALVADPSLPQVPANIVLPRWTGTAFLSGSATIRQEFERLVHAYAIPAANSPALRRGNPAQTPPDDILGRPRPAAPSIGAAEPASAAPPATNPPSAPQPAARAVVDNAEFEPLLAPGTLAALFGENLAAETLTATTLPLPSVLGGVSVDVEGLPGPLLYVSPGQIVFQVPYWAPNRGQLYLRYANGDSSNPLPYELVPAAPAIFRSAPGQGVILDALTGDLIGDSRPATPGGWLLIYCTGLGSTDGGVEGASASEPSPALVRVRVWFGNSFAEPAYAGLSIGFPGVYQINVRVPDFLASGAVPLTIEANGRRSKPVTVPVQGPA
jgi:uncharacterized protein (TIGR03437 family)